jgi:hypothetical protein
MQYKSIGKIARIETIAYKHSIREIARLRKLYGGRRWLKQKGFARVILLDDTEHEAEVHWYEAHGVGRKEIKIKRLLDE